MTGTYIELKREERVYKEGGGGGNRKFLIKRIIFYTHRLVVELLV